jgi:hypothetical protein
MTAEEYLNQSLGSSDTGMSADLFLDEQLKEPADTSIGDTLQKTAADLEMSIADIPLALGEAFSGLTKTVPASFYAAKEGLARPDQYSKEALAAFDTQREYFKKLEQEAATRKAEGRMTTAGEAIRGAGQSLGFTVAGMAPAIAGGAIAGAAAGALFPPAEVATIPIGAIAGGIGSMVASAPVSYRMAGGQFLYDAFKSLEENKGSPLTEEEKTKAYNELLPIAQNTALWEAGPEAIGNAVQLGALKYAFGFGKKAATNVAGQAIEKANNTLLKKVGAVAGGQAIELAGETITQTQQGPDQAKMEQYVQTGSTAGAPNEYEGLAGAVKAFKEVAPTTLALGAITAGAGGVVKVAGMGGKEVGKVLFTKPKTPEQIAEDQINDASNRVANDLSISPDDTEANNLNQQIKALSEVQEIRKQTLAAIEPTSREAQTLKLDIAEGETMLGELNQNLTKLTGLSETITEAGKQQIELARAITAKPKTEEELRSRFDELKVKAEGTKQTEQTLPDGTKIVMPAVEGQLLSLEEGGEYRQLKQKFEPTPAAPVTPAAKVAPPTEPTIKESLPVAPEAPAITPAPVEEVAPAEEPYKISKQPPTLPEANAPATPAVGKPSPTKRISPERASQLQSLGFISNSDPGISIETAPNPPAFGGGWVANADELERRVVYRDEKGKPKGYLRFYIKEQGSKAVDATEGLEVYVEPEYRRKGIAKQLYATASQAGYDVMSVSGTGAVSEAGAALSAALKQPAPVAETPAVTPAAEVAPTSWIAPEQKLTPQESRALQVANLRGTEKRTGNITFVPEKLMTPQRLQSLRTEQESSGTLKRFPKGGKFIEIKMMADVTGDPYAKGWAIIDRRPDLNRREWIAQIPSRDERILAGSIANNESEKIVSAIKEGIITQERSNQLVDEAANNQIISSDFANNLKTAISNSTPAASETITPAAEPAAKPKLGEKGGVLIPSREDFIQAGQNIYEAGMEFGTWAKQMIQQFGDVVREFLGEVWQAVSGMPAKLNEVMGYLPKKGEGGELSFGKTGKLKRYTDKGTIVKLAIKQEKDTPKGILSETIKIIKQRVFDGDSTPSESATKKAWGLIERLVVTNPDSTSTAEAINQLTRETMQEVSVAEDATEGERQAFEAIKQTVGATKLNNELYKYAIKLAGQGDDSMLNYLLNNELNVVGTSVRSVGDVGRTLGALAGLKSYIIQANEAEQAGFIQLAAQRFFNTTTPTEDQIAKIKRILTAVNETKVNEEEAILEELTQVGEKIGTELVENINTQIDKASKPEVKDPMVAAITAMLKLGGTFVYRKTKNKIKAAVEKTIKGGITNYRNKLVEGAANGLETGFWKTLSSKENKPGPLGELDSAQNRELGNIVKNTLVSMKLQGKPPNTKMSVYKQVASILGEKPLSQDKINSADEKIRAEINRKREKELEETEDQDVQDAINLKYDRIEFAWDEAMSRNLDMPVSDTMLRRLIFNELKEGKTSIAKLAALMDEEPTIGTVRQDRIVSSIINKIAGVTFEGQNPADYTALKEYLGNQLELLVQEKQTEKKVVKAKEKVKANQGQNELDKLARIQSDTPNFPTSEKVANPVRDAVRNALKLVLNPMFDPKAAADIMRNWKKEFAAELQQLGVDEATALTLTDVVGRQIELDSVSKNLDSIDNAINKGALSGVINAIKNTPLADQQKPNWRYEVMRDYLRSAGLSMAQAEKIAKLMDISLQKRFAKAQEEAAASIAKTILGGIKPESNRGFTALIQAIRAQVLNPGSNVAMEFGRAMGWKGFTPEQLKALNEFDSKINDETITEAERAVALEGIKKIIDKVSLPTKVRNAISAFYIGNALGRFTVATVQVIDPIIFSMWDAAVASARNVTSPSQVMQIWGNFGSSLINAANEFAFSFKNDVTRSGRLVDYLETQDRKLKRLLNDANNLWKSGKYIQATKKYLFGSAEITSRVLKALDDAAFSLLQQNALNQYMISAMNMAKIPKKDQLATLRMITQARQMDIADMMATGIKKNDATIYANERMKAEISKAMSGLNLNSTEIIDSAINESLSRIGKTRFKEQLSGETELKDEGTLSYPFLKIYELTSQAISGVKGKRGEAMRIFQRMFFGFPLIVARVANVAYGYTPLTIYRHAMQKKFGNYPLTYGTAIQRRKRLAEQLAGTAVLLPLLFLRSMSFDDDDDKKPISIVFTGFGPVRSKDPEAYNQWNKKHNPGSLEIFIGGNRYALDSKSAGPLKPMIEILGAIDDWQIRKFQDNAKLTKEEIKKVEENAGLLGTLGQIAGSFALTAARRGPATGLMQGLIDFRRYPDDPIAAIAQEASFSLIPLIPVAGFGATKNISDFLSEPIDTRTKEGAILNNIPIIGPMFGKPAINAFGQPIGDIEISEKIKKSIGIPITLVPVSSGDDAKLAKITLKNANGPEPLQRNWFDAKFETPLSDQEWRTVNEDYARSNRKTVLENYEELNGFDPEIYKTAISNVGTASKYSALDNLYKARKKP